MGNNQDPGKTYRIRNTAKMVAKNVKKCYICQLSANEAEKLKK
jgi:hypothetical protein